MNAPLAERLRPKKLTDYISQAHLIGPEGALTQALKQGLIPSMIFWGPPGIGKTTLANIIAQESERPFYTLSAISSGVKDLPPKILFCLLTKSIVLANLNKTRCYKLLKKAG